VCKGRMTLESLNTRICTSSGDRVTVADPRKKSKYDRDLQLEKHFICSTFLLSSYLHFHDVIWAIYTSVAFQIYLNEQYQNTFIDT